jgi:hypothetical protein
VKVEMVECSKEEKVKVRKMVMRERMVKIMLEVKKVGKKVM